MLADILKSKFAIYTGVAILLVGLFYVGREAYRKYQINREIKGLESQIADMEDKNREILSLIDYYKSTEYKERQARTLLNLQKPGEFAVALPAGKDEVGREAGENQAEQQSNLNKWWDYFFAK